MKKNIITTTLAAAMVATTILTTGISAQAAEAPAAQTQVVKQNLNPTVIAKVFDAKYYAEAYPDVVAVLGSDPAVLLNHYVTSGIYEGRDASATFNASIYALANSDIAAAYGDNLEAYVEHYLAFGAKENRIACNEQMAKLDIDTQAQIASQGAATFEAKGVTAISFASTYSSQAPQASLWYGDIVKINANGDTAVLGEEIYRGNGQYVTYRPTGNGGYYAEYSFKNIYLDAAVYKNLADQGDPVYIQWVADHPELYDENGNAKPAPKNAIYNERGEAIGTRSESSGSGSSSSGSSSSAPAASSEPARVTNEAGHTFNAGMLQEMGLL